MRILIDLYRQPQEEWCGGLVHRITPHIVHLMRGEIYEIEGCSFFVMGGYKSSAKWQNSALWWPQEIPSEDELRHAYRNLQLHHNRVDYVLTHHYLSNAPEEALPLHGLFRYIDEQVDFKHWYSGHRHTDESLDNKHSVIFQRAIPISPVT